MAEAGFGTWHTLTDWAVATEPARDQAVALSSRHTDLTRGLALYLLKSRAHLRALVPAARLARWLLLAGEREYALAALRYIEPRAILLPEAQRELEAARHER